MNVFLAEHVISYIISFVRMWDLKKNGNPNSSGIQSSPLESKLNLAQIAIRVILSVFSILYMFSYENGTFYSKPFLHYWIFIDVVIMILMIPYMNLS